MRCYGLIGYPLGHSFSATFFASKFESEGIADCIYKNYPIKEVNELKNIIINNQNLLGLNVTIPHKLNVIKLLDEIDGAAEEIGAVNCLKIKRNGGQYKIKGFNTDVYGFEKPLKEIIKPSHKKALVLGVGGAAKAVYWVLKNLNIQYKAVSRVPRNKEVLSYEQVDASILKEHTIIINTSPLGMHPKIDEAPNIPYNDIGTDHILYDLIYNPKETRFLKLGKSQGAKTINGLPMLHLQAEKSWEIWNDTNEF